MLVFFSIDILLLLIKIKIKIIRINNIDIMTLLGFLNLNFR